jgi:sec-independent protein translocase protein TatA
MGLDNPLHIAFLLIVVLLVFGAKRLPEVGRSLGSGMRGFKESLSGLSADTAPQALPGPPQAPVAAADSSAEAAPAAAPAPASVPEATPVAPGQAAGVAPLPQVSEPMPPAA